MLKPGLAGAKGHASRRLRGIRSRSHQGKRVTLHKVTPSEAWELMFSHFGFSIDDLCAFMLNGIDGAWVDEPTREMWRTQWLDEFDAGAATLR